jgi:dienelactone hydrolase
MKRSAFSAFFIVMVLITILFSKVYQEHPSCQGLDNPVDDQTFKAYLDFFKYDKNLSFELQIIDVKEYEGIRKEHLSFQSTPGERVYANLYSSIGQEIEKSPAIIFIHGAAAQGKDSQYNAHLVEFITRDNWIVLAIDMKYFGERSTDVLTTFTEKDKHDQLYNKPTFYLEWLTQTIKDVRRSFDFLVEEKGVDSSRIGYVGFSRGAIVGPVLGGIDKRFAAIVMLFGAHFDALERGHLPAACPANYIGHISPRPLLMINGIRDTDMIKDTQVLPLYELAKSPKKIIWVEGGHGSLTNKARSEMLQWLTEQVK